MEPVYSQNVFHSMQSHPMSYMNTSPINGLTYQYPGFLNNYTYGSNIPQNYYSREYTQKTVPYSNTHYVTSNYPSAPISNIHSKQKVEFVNNQISRQVETKQILESQQKHTVNLPGVEVINRENLVGTGIRSVQQINTKALQGYSSIEYIPYESYYIDYEERQFIQNVVVPVQKKITDYYALQHVVDYVPKQIQQTVIQMVPEEVVSDRLYYVPVQTQIVHLPKNQNAIPSTQQIRASRSVEKIIPNGNMPINKIQQTTTTPPPYQVSQPQFKSYNPQQETITGYPPTNIEPRRVVQGQPMQNYEPIQGNLSQNQQQHYFPQNAKMQYHHSTKMVRNLSPGEVPRTQSLQKQPTMVQPSQFQSNSANQIPGNIDQKDNQRFLQANNTIDMVTSEHVDIPQTPYDTGSNNPQSLNPPSTYTLGTGQPGARDSQRVSLEPAITVNRNTANFNQNKFNSNDPANRISNGSIYDYDQLRDY